MHFPRPKYREEPAPVSEVIAEETSEVDLAQLQDHLEEDLPDSEDEAPVFLDLTALKTDKQAEVHGIPPTSVIRHTIEDITIHIHVGDTRTYIFPWGDIMTCIFPWEEGVVPGHAFLPWGDTTGHAFFPWGDTRTCIFPSG